MGPAGVCACACAHARVCVTWRAGSRDCGSESRVGACGAAHALLQPTSPPGHSSIVSSLSADALAAILRARSLADLARPGSRRPPPPSAAWPPPAPPPPYASHRPSSAAPPPPAAEPVAVQP
eukprot:5952232-Prymnesium_polylepis.1